MTQFKLTNKINSKMLLVALLVAAGISTYTIKIKDAKAAVGVSGLTGKYSCLSNRNFLPAAAWLVGGATTGANALAILDFDAHTSNILVFTNSNWGQSSVTSSTITATSTFTEVAGPISGSFQTVETYTPSSGPTFTSKTNFVVANSGNTLFFSTDASANKTPETGVCQKQ